MDCKHDDYHCNRVLVVVTSLQRGSICPNGQDAFVHFIVRLHVHRCRYGNNSGSPFTPPFVFPAPLKFVAVPTGPSSVRQWWVPDVRQSVMFVLFSGGTTMPVERARSHALKHSAPGHPMHVRLGRTASASQMLVSWTSAGTDGGSEVSE